MTFFWAQSSYKQAVQQKYFLHIWKKSDLPPNKMFFSHVMIGRKEWWSSYNLLNYDQSN